MPPPLLLENLVIRVAIVAVEGVVVATAATATAAAAPPTPRAAAPWLLRLLLPGVPKGA